VPWRRQRLCGRVRTFENIEQGLAVRFGRILSRRSLGGEEVGVTHGSAEVGDSALAKVERARSHLREIEGALHGYAGTRSELHSAEGVLKFVIRVDQPLPADLPLMVGDCLHNLRSALDHLVYECNANPGDRSCQFPTWTDKPERFNRGKWREEVKRRMKAPGAAQLRTLLLELEAYQGGAHEFLWLLQELDVIDKHRLLLTALSAASKAWFEASVEITTAEPTGEPLDRFVAYVDPADPLALQAEGSIRIELDPQTPFPLEDGTVAATWQGPGVDAVTKGGLEFAMILRDPQPEPDAYYLLIPLLHQLADQVEEFLHNLLKRLGSGAGTTPI